MQEDVANEEATQMEEERRRRIYFLHNSILKIFYKYVERRKRVELF